MSRTHVTDTLHCVHKYNVVCYALALERALETTHYPDVFMREVQCPFKDLDMNHDNDKKPKPTMIMKFT